MKIPSIELNLDNPRGLISPSVWVLTESVLDFRFLSFPTFPYALGYVVLVLRLTHCCTFLVSALCKSPCVFQEVSRASCINITLRDKNRFLDWRYSRIFARAELQQVF